MEKKISSWFFLCSALIGGTLLAYSQTLAFAWDEGFHLIAAHLIRIGKRPYLDFAFAQTPLNAYWNAGWMRVFGEKWRVIHAIDALMVVGAIMLAADFVRSRWKEEGGWAAIPVLFFAGANPAVMEYGPIAQAYAIGMLLTVTAFRLTIACERQNRTLFAGLAGFCAAAAAGSTLLAAPAAPILFLWLLIFSGGGTRVRRAAAFAGGAVVGLIPLLLLFVQSPHQVIFDVFRYHMFFRRSDWPGATQHDLELYTSVLTSPWGILLGVLSVAGVWFIARESRWDRETRREFYLAGCLGVVLGFYVSTAHPTFAQYWVFAIVFLSILAAVGLFALGSRLAPGRSRWVAAGVCIWTYLALAREVYDKRDDQSWPGMEAIAKKVDAVTAPGAPLYADEHIYWLTGRTPPSGNEYMSSHKLRLPKALSEMVHIIPQPEWDRRILAGEFATVETCDDEDWIKQRKLTEIYKKREEIDDCNVFWDRASAGGRGQQD